MKVSTAEPPTASQIGTSGTKEGEFLSFQALKKRRLFEDFSPQFRSIFIICCAHQGMVVIQ